jgi:hypothetical protein
LIGSLIVYYYPLEHAWMIGQNVFTISIYNLHKAWPLISPFQLGASPRAMLQAIHQALKKLKSLFADVH